MSIKKASLTSKQLAKKIAELALDKKATDLVVLDMRKVVNFCDYFVICSGNTDRQTRAIANGIDEGLAELNLKVPKTQGSREGRWVLIDLGAVVVHIFEKQTREFYGLEYLWQEAKEVKI